MITDEIQQEIERTRGEMAGTLQAIEDKLSPRQLLNQAVDTMRELTSDRSRLGAAMRDNPIPLLIIGLGVGWLAFSGGRRAEARPARGSEAGDLASGWAVGKGEADFASAAGVAGSGYGAEGGSGYGAETGAESGPMSEAGRAAALLRGRAQQVAGQARQNLQRAGDVTRQRMSEWGRSAGDVANQSWEAYQEHPLTVGVAAVVVGAAIGAMLPRTPVEGRMLGGAVEDMVSRARETGNELIDRAGRVAKSALNVARQQVSDVAKVADEATTLH